jgi:hypothetical protein
MQVLNQRRSLQRWWIIFLFIPMLVSCAVPVALWEVALQIGANLAYTATGQFIEQVVDNLVEKLFHGNSPGYVIPDPGNSLQGTYSTKMRFTTIDPAGQRRGFEINKPRMVRDSESSIWQLAPDLRGLVNQILEGRA